MKFGTHQMREVTGAGGNERHRIEFPNGHGASVVRGPYTYGGPDGRWEVGVLDSDGHLDYSTPITNDVIGYLTDAEVIETLDAIAALTPESIAAGLAKARVEDARDQVARLRERLVEAEAELAEARQAAEVSA